MVKNAGAGAGAGAFLLYRVSGFGFGFWFRSTMCPGHISLSVFFTAECRYFLVLY